MPTLVLPCKAAFSVITKSADSLGGLCTSIEIAVAMDPMAACRTALGRPRYSMRQHWYRTFLCIHGCNCRETWRSQLDSWVFPGMPNIFSTTPGAKTLPYGVSAAGALRGTSAVYISAKETRSGTNRYGLNRNGAGPSSSPLNMVAQPTVQYPSHRQSACRNCRAPRSRESASGR